MIRVFPIPARLVWAVLVGAAVVAVFVQIERGIGNLVLTLLYVAHNLMMCGAFGLLLLQLTRRRWTALVVGVGIVFLVWFASYLKVAATDIPALASDLPRILDTWGVIVDFGWPALGAGLALLLASMVLAWREQPVALSPGRRLAGLGAIAGLLVASGAIQARIPADDDDVLTNNGPKIAQFFRSVYARPDFRDASVPALGPYCCFRSAASPALRFRGQVMPNIVVVLQESTFPPQNLRGVAAAPNRLLDGAAPLRVDVIGGGTWVEEYAMLHGVAPHVYGRDFLQILWLGREMGLEGRIAPMLARAGYDTVSIFPYFGQELGDSAAMQRSLGFGKVVDCSGIRGCEQGGDWTSASDADVFGRILAELRSGSGPFFVYAATLRQHSPHVSGYPKKAYRREILAEYERRLALSGKEADDFLRELRALDRPTLVLMFGDHIPSDVNAAFPEEDFLNGKRQTFFNLFDVSGQAVSASIMARHPGVRATSTAYLDAILLDYAGFESDYIDRKLAMMRECQGAFCVRETDASVATGPAGRR